MSAKKDWMKKAAEIAWRRYYSSTRCGRLRNTLWNRLFFCHELLEQETLWNDFFKKETLAITERGLDMKSELCFYVKSMGKVFRVRHIAQSEDDANAFCAKHPSTGVIAEDTDKGIIFIADLNEIRVSSGVLP